MPLSPPDSPSRQRLCDAVIVGAGVSGLAAARALTEAGQRCVVLEARGRLGGRVDHVPGHPSVDLGPAWFWPHSQHVRAAVQDLDLSAFPQEASGATVIDRGAGVPPQRAMLPDAEGSALPHRRRRDGDGRSSRQRPQPRLRSARHCRRAHRADRLWRPRPHRFWRVRRPHLHPGASTRGRRQRPGFRSASGAGPRAPDARHADLDVVVGKSRAGLPSRRVARGRTQRRGHESGRPRPAVLRRDRTRRVHARGLWRSRRTACLWERRRARRLGGPGAGSALLARGPARSGHRAGLAALRRGQAPGVCGRATGVRSRSRRRPQDSPPARRRSSSVTTRSAIRSGTGACTSPARRPLARRRGIWMGRSPEARRWRGPCSPRGPSSLWRCALAHSRCAGAHTRIAPEAENRAVFWAGMSFDLPRDVRSHP